MSAFAGQLVLVKVVPPGRIVCEKKKMGWRKGLFATIKVKKSSCFFFSFVFKLLFFSPPTNGFNTKDFFYAASLN